MSINRRNALKLLGLAGSGLLFSNGVPAKTNSRNSSLFKYCLNTSTISGQDIALKESIEIAAQAGYDGIELWVRDVKKYLNDGNSASELKNFIEMKGLVVENAIGFAPWMVSSDGVEQLKEEMLLMKSIGCKRMAAPASGVDQNAVLDLTVIGQKYHEILEIGRATGVQPILEFWGAFQPFHLLGQALMAAACANDPDAKILADVFHLFRGGSGFNGLKLMSGESIEVFHMNDYPAGIPREQQKDSHRVYPGDGVAPFDQIIPALNKMGGEKILSLELFNEDYWKQDPLLVAQTGLTKMKELVEQYT